MNFLSVEHGIIILILLNIILIVLYIINIIQYNYLNKKYKKFMKSLSGSTNIEQSLSEYLKKVNNVKDEQLEIIENIKCMKEDLNKCIQKIGMVRYNAFKDTGSDLSFALALLDMENNGVVLNGIYSREMSNIYAKNIVNGKCTYKLSEEEEKAVIEAMKL